MEGRALHPSLFISSFGLIHKRVCVFCGICGFCGFCVLCMYIKRPAQFLKTQITQFPQFTHCYTQGVFVSKRSGSFFKRDFRGESTIRKPSLRKGGRRAQPDGRIVRSRSAYGRTGDAHPPLLFVVLFPVHGALGGKAVRIARFQLVNVILQDRFKIVADRGRGLGKIPRDVAELLG